MIGLGRLGMLGLVADAPGSGVVSVPFDKTISASADDGRDTSGFGGGWNAAPAAFCYSAHNPVPGGYDFQAGFCFNTINCFTCSSAILTLRGMICPTGPTPVANFAATFEVRIQKQFSSMVRWTAANIPNTATYETAVSGAQTWDDAGVWPIDVTALVVANMADPLWAANKRINFAVWTLTTPTAEVLYFTHVDGVVTPARLQITP